MCGESDRAAGSVLIWIQENEMDVAKDISYSQGKQHNDGKADQHPQANPGIA